MDRSARPGGQAAIRKLVIHLNVGPEIQGGAQSLANYLAGEDAGYHEIVDNQTYVQCARPDERVNGASGMNDAGYHICVIGTIQSADQWHDAYSRNELDLAALRVAARCHDFGLPPNLLTDGQIADPNGRGICDHWGVNRAIVKPLVARGNNSLGPGDHTDVGAGFPWVEFIANVQHAYNPAAPKPVAKPPIWKVKPMHKPYTATWSADCDAPHGGAWMLTADGGVLTLGSAPYRGSPTEIHVTLAPGDAWNEIRVPDHAKGDPMTRIPSMGGGPTSYVCVTSADHRYGF